MLRDVFRLGYRLSSIQYSCRLCTSRNLSEIELNRRNIFDEVGKKLRIKSLDDWYQVTLATVNSSSDAKGVLRFYGKSLPKALLAIYPEHSWQLWRFRSRDGFDYFDSEENQRIFISELSKALHINQLDDWYRVSLKDFDNHGGTPLLKRYNGLMLDLLQTLYPNHPWDGWRFNQPLTKGYWKDLKHQRHYFDRLAKHLNIQTWDDWSTITVLI